MKIFKLFLLFTFLIFSTLGTAHAASIAGTVTYKGKRPKLRPIRMDADQICLRHHKNGEEVVLPTTIRLGENLEMAGAFLRIVGGLPNKTWPTPTEPIVLTQAGCMYDPPVFGVMVNQPIKILNPDGTLHNVHALPKINKEFNIAMPKFRKEVTKSFDKPEFMFQMKCDVHPWMVTHITVLEHPYFDTTELDGKYSIDDLPPGEYVIEAWHQRLEPQRVTVQLAEGETKEIDFTFQRPDGK